jgi:DNA-binding response OmpR family regulator
MAKLMLVEDDAPLRIGLRLALEDEGHVVVEAADGEDALDAFDASGAELVLLDVRLPGISGFEVCRELRKRSLVPIVMVTAQDDTHDMVAGLEAGADDYVTKPVSAKALAARVRAHLRRANWTGHGEPPAVAVAGTGLDIREAQGLVLKHGERLSLTKTEFHLLCEFARHPNQVMSRDQLLESVWGYDYVGDGRLVDTHIRRLRTKIEDDPERPRVIITARGLGYRFEPSGIDQERPGLAG